MSTAFLYDFLRYALGLKAGAVLELSEAQWVELHRWATVQHLVGVMYGGVERLAHDSPENSENSATAITTLPRKLALRWSMEAEHIRGLNRNVDEVSARLTGLFEEAGVCTLILKGSANALLYPDPSLRQTGDVDIWVEGGREHVIGLLKRLRLFDGAAVGTLHVHLDNRLFGMEVEIHFSPTRQCAPAKDANLQAFLAGEVASARRVPQGFFVPGTAYALVMQLSHIKQHLFSCGIGLRQLVDYHLLLLHSTAEERARVAAQLIPCGLDQMAGAVMYLLREVLGLADNLMLCPPDVRRGKFLMDVVLSGGNFGWYAEDYKQPVVMRWLKDRVRILKLVPFDADECLWHEIRYWKKTLQLMPVRISQRRLALGKR